MFQELFAWWIQNVFVLLEFVTQLFVVLSSQEIFSEFLEATIRPDRLSFLIKILHIFLLSWEKVRFSKCIIRYWINSVISQCQFSVNLILKMERMRNLRNKIHDFFSGAKLAVRIWKNKGEFMRIVKLMRSRFFLGGVQKCKGTDFTWPRPPRLPLAYF